MSRRTVRSALAGATALSLMLAPTAAMANDDAPTEPMEVRGSSNSVGQSVQIRTNADGDPNSATIDFRWSVTQIGAQGDPGADITVAVPEEGLLLHNLQEFGMIPQEDGKGQFDISLNDSGFGTARSVSLVPPEDFELPVELTTEFTLDGEPILAQDLVGKDGVVTAKYTVINKTRETLTVPITSVTGDEIEKEVEADVPMVVEAVTLLPDRFSALNTGTGLGGADGRGNTQVKWIALPFSPLSADGTSSFGWAANVTNAVIPSMLVQVLPIYIPEGEEGDEEGLTEEQKKAARASVPPPDVSGDVAAIKDGVADVISGLETLTADDGSADPLDVAEGKINAFFDEFATNFADIAALTDPNNPESITSDIRAFNASLAELQAAVAELKTALDKYDESQIPEAIATIDSNFDKFIDAVEGALALLDGIVPGKDNPEKACPIIAAIPDAGVTAEQCTSLVALLELVIADIPATEAAIDDLNNVLKQVDGAVAVLQPLLEKVAGLLEGVTASLTALDPKLVALNEQLTIISNGLAEKTVDLPSLDAVLADITESILNSEGGQQVTGGLDQVSGGIAGVQSEISSYVAELVVALTAAQEEVGAAVEDGKEAAGAVIDKADTLKAEVVGLKTAAQTCPLPYGCDVTEAPEGTKLAGAYEFRMDPADQEAPSTLPRVLLGLVLLLVAGFIGARLVTARQQAAVAAAGGGSGPDGPDADEPVDGGYPGGSDEGGSAAGLATAGAAGAGVTAVALADGEESGPDDTTALAVDAPEELSEAVDSAEGAVGEAADQAEDEVGDMADQADDVVGDAADSVEGAAAEATDSAGDVAQDAGDAVERAAEDATGIDLPGGDEGGENKPW